MKPSEYNYDTFRRELMTPLGGGLLTGAALYIFGFWILPSLFPAWLAPFALPTNERILQGVAHIVYGLSFGFCFGWLRTSAPAAGSQKSSRSR